MADLLQSAESVVIVWGERVGRQDRAVEILLEIASRLDLVGKEGSGLLEVPDFTNARGLREVGCLPDAGPGLSADGAPLSPHMGENGARSGKSTEEIRAALESGELKSLILFGVDPLRDLPDTAAWERALTAADHVVVFSMFENATTAKADVVFPLETFAEKDGTVTHPDGRIQRVRPSASRPGEVRANHNVLAELALALGHDTGIGSQPSALAAIADAVPFYAGLTDDEIGGRGIRWQDRPASSALPASEPVGGVGISSERFAESAQTTPADDPNASGPLPSEEDVPTPSSGSDDVPTAPGSLVLGTYRDLWAGPVTELNPPLKFLEPRQSLEISLADAERLGLKNGDPVRVGQNGSSVEARVAIKERVSEGVCFLIEGTAESNANALLNGGPVAVQIEKVG